MLFSLPTLAEPQHFSVLEKVLFAGLVLGSVYAFWHRFGVCSRQDTEVEKGREFSSLPYRQARPRLRVGGGAPGQGHPPTARGRPGACIRLLGVLRIHARHVESLCERLWPGFLSPSGVIGRFYFWITAVFAAACAVGILGLFIRRFLIRPKWLGAKLSWESGFIALLIFALMVTYLASFATADASLSTRLLWWVHSLALFVFLPIIPHTKHLHLLLSPFTVFLSRGSFSQIPPLSAMKISALWQAPT